MSRFVRIAFSFLTLLCAPVLLLQGWANAQNVASPSFGWNGYNLALLAMSRVQVAESDGNLSVSVRDGGVELAQQAFAKEPLASDALFVLALNERAQGNQQRMRQILQAADTLDKRNRNIGALQLEQVSQGGDVSQTFGIIDRLTTVHPDLMNQFVQPLVLALRDPLSVAPLRDALSYNPVWATAFWNSVPTDAESVARMYELRRQTNIGTTEQSDGRLLAGLARQELYLEAFEFWQEVAEEAENPFGYVADQALAPFGWQLTTTGERAVSPRGEGRFDIYIQNDTSGELARQLVRLPRGSYSFDAQIDPENEAGRISARLECATADSGPGTAQALSGAVQWTISGSCETYWLILTGESWNMREALRATISDMQFQASS